MSKRIEKAENLVKEIIGDIRFVGEKYDVANVFRDYLLMLAYSVSNSCDKVHYEARETEYLKVINKYDTTNRSILINLCTKLIDALELSMFEKDLLGEIFNELGLYNKRMGQNFTKSGVPKVLSDITVNSSKKNIEENGYFVMNEPTCGSGSLIIATAGSLLEKGFNPAENMCVYATDLDWRCVMMTYIQLSYLGIPAVVARADCLKVEEYERFYTPVYIFNNWIWKEQLGMTTKKCIDDEKLKCLTEPMYGIMKYGTKRRNGNE